MAERLLKKKPRKVAPKKATSDEPKKCVLVGTYKEKQLAWIKRHGVYNYPVKDGDEFDARAFASIKELWLYADVKGTRHVFEADFVGIKTRDELVEEYGYLIGTGNGKRGTGNGRARTPAAPHGSRYYVFKAKFLEYGSRLENPVVIARAADFGGRSLKVKKAIEQFKADGEFAPLSHYLPSDIACVPASQLRVCEAAVQSRLEQWTPVIGVSPLLCKIESFVMSIGEFGRTHALSSGESYAYLKKFKGLEYLDKYHEPLSCFPMESLIDDLTRVCRNNGGKLR